MAADYYITAKHLGDTVKRTFGSNDEFFKSIMKMAVIIRESRLASEEGIDDQTLYIHRADSNIVTVCLKCPERILRLIIARYRLRANTHT